jgi:ELWxxDGT repeat protein
LGDFRAILQGGRRLPGTLAPLVAARIGHAPPPARFPGSLPAAAAATTRRLRIEPLENRRLLATMPKLIELNTAGHGIAPEEIVNVNGVLYFSAFDVTADRELWRSDGTQAGTFRLRDIYPGEIGSQPHHLTKVGNRLFFAASSPDGEELWTSDGTVAGTVQVKDIAPGTYIPPFGTSEGHSSRRRQLTAWRADERGQQAVLLRQRRLARPVVEVRRDDYRDRPPQRVFSPSNGGFYAPTFADINGTLFFTGYGDGGPLWKSDGTTAGTVSVTPFGTIRSLPSKLHNAAGVSYFIADTAAHEGVVWRSDGTAAGTIPLVDDHPITGPPAF